MHGVVDPVGVSVLASRNAGALRSGGDWSARLGVLCGAGRGGGAELPVFWDSPDGSFRGCRCNRWRCGVPGEVTFDFSTTATAEHGFSRTITFRRLTTLPSCPV